MEAYVWPVLLLIGVISAVFGSIVGLGGGIITVPVLILIGPDLLGEPVPSQVAVGTSLAVLIFTALSSTWTYQKQGKVDFRSGWLFFATSGPSAMVGAQLTKHIQQGPFEFAFGLFMFVMFALMVARERMKPLVIDWPIMRTFTDGQGQTYHYGYNVWVGLLIGCGVGLASGLFGIGGGSLFVPLMVLLFRFPPHVATATSMFVILLSSILGSGVHAWHGHIDWRLFAFLAPGALIGGRVGAVIASKLSGRQLLWLLRATLLAMAVYLIIKGIGEM
ncbi:sulfite exporter TauE/SafE family protein [Cohnella pontilimi]|uniref:Probable membrane transporter protein n=1 Tax=Cohnella pontilimi TaxID=2564100 RepID=A0A4U0FCL0_9BACL|nr:sulfite exporter TauE/SafE family protein [Cohnella pontilimi]TJY42480.1 sulfite exporter TauE/SafE family protein [Cohnella pontilimi]